MKKPLAEVRDKQIQYGMWLGLPIEARDPKTQEELGEVLDIRPETLARWKKVKAVKDARANALMVFANRKHRYEIIQAMIERAKEKGGNQDRKLFFQWTGEIEGKRQNHSPDKPIELNIKLTRDNG